MNLRSKVLMALSGFTLCLCCFFGRSSVYAQEVDYPTDNMLQLCSHWSIDGYLADSDTEYYFMYGNSFSEIPSYYYTYQNGVITFNYEAASELASVFDADAQIWFYFEFNDNTISTNAYTNFFLLGDWSNEYVFSFYNGQRVSYSLVDAFFTNPVSLPKDTYIKSIFVRGISCDEFNHFSIASNNSYYAGYKNGYSEGKTEGQSYGETIGYNNGYDVGYQHATDDIQPTINGLNNTINDLTYQLDFLQGQYNELARRYQNLSNTNNLGLDNLFWSIGGTPFGTLQSVLNVNVLGFNLGGIITGLITALVVIWLIKKVF